MERSSSVLVLACLALVVSAGVVPGMGGSTDSPSRTAAGASGSSFDGMATSDDGVAVDTTQSGTAVERRVTELSRPTTPANNTTARLTLPRTRVTQSHFETVRIGLASTLQSGRDGAGLARDRIAIEREFDAADTVKAKRNTIDKALIALEDETAAMEARERRVIRHYGDGNITGQTLMRRLARIDATARNTRETLGLLRTLSDRVGVTVFDSRIRDVEGQLATLQGPVRHRSAEALAGEASSTRVHVTASDTGVVLATMTGDHYVRETTEWRNRNASRPPELDLGDVGTRTEELYPWVTNEGGWTGVQWQGAGIWRFRASHPHGTLTAYVDAGTGDVFREVQRLAVDDMPATTIIDDTTDDLRVTLERTYVGGPLRIYVENAATSAAVNARVVVDGHDLGNAGADGYLRTIEPRTPYNVTVIDGDDTVTFTVDPDESGG